MVKHIAAAILAALLGSAAQASYTLTSTNFEGSTTGWSGAGGVVPTFGNKYWFNDSSAGDVSGATAFTFNVSTATGASLSALLGIIDTWDNGVAGYGPDSFKVEIDGVQVFSAVFDNFQNLGPTSAPGLTSVSYGSNLIGSSTNDAVYNLNISLGVLSAGTHTLKFYAAGPGWQGGSDESFALDNVVITVPEPETVAMALAGALVLGSTRRMRYKR